MSESSKSKFFTYEDGDGHTFVVDSLDAIPKKYRDLAEEMSVEDAVAKLGDLEEKASEGLKDARKLKKKGVAKAKEVQREVGDVVPFVKDLDLPSVAVGFALSLLFVLVLSIVKKTGKLILKLALIAAIVCLLAGAYFGWLRRAAGFGDDRLATPGQVIQDARKAASRYQERIDDQEGTLRKIEEESR